MSKSTNTRIEITELPVDSIHFNDYNPNQMTEVAFEELVTEVKHLGRIPKPVVVRPNADGYEIVDGAHTFAAARDAGMETIPCEVVDIDDFEAMRQTWKRNQHGNHNPVLEGRMFRLMLEQSGLSQRGLAEEVSISEGTIRNCLAYARLADLFDEDFHPDEEVRNGYASRVSQMKVRIVRDASTLPERWQRLWLTSYVDERTEGSPLDKYSSQWYADVEWLLDYVATWGRFRHFENIRGEVRGKWNFINSCVQGGLELEDLKPYFIPHFEEQWHVREESFLLSAFNIIVDTTEYPAKICLTPEEWSAICENADNHSESVLSFEDRVKQAMFRKVGEDADLSPQTGYQLRMLELEIENEAPDYIKESSLPVLEKEKLWKADGMEEAKQALALRESLPYDWKQRIKETEEAKEAIEVADELSVEEIAEKILWLVSDRLGQEERAFNDEAEALERFKGLGKDVLMLLWDCLSRQYSFMYSTRRLQALLGSRA